MDKVAVLIPTYNRPDSLALTLEKLNQFNIVKAIFVAADASSSETLQEYSEITSKYSGKVIAELTLGHRGSAKTRNAVRRLALQNMGKTEFTILFDDDFQLPNEAVIKDMIQSLRSHQKAGVIGGRILNIKKRAIDPEFSLPLPQIIVNKLESLTGFLFYGKTKGISIVKTTSCFMLLKSELLNQVSYDENYQGTGYREESDFQRQILNLGFDVLSSDKAFVYHAAPDEGGCRERQNFSDRMYWKSRNHVYFLLKWNKDKLTQSLWYILLSELLLISYRPSSLFKILKGLKSGYRLANEFSN